MISSLNRLFGRVRRAASNEDGVAAVEFALISPVLILGFFASVEICNTLVADRKVTSVASTVADLIAQEVELDDDELADIFDAAEALLAPLPTGTLRITIQSIIDDDGDQEVAWTETLNGGAPGATTTLPQGVLTRNGSVIYVRTEYTHETGVGHFLGDTFAFADEFYARPRRSIEVFRD